jgi:release factor glutamine methyltransferase
LHKEVLISNQLQDVYNWLLVSLKNEEAKREAIIILKVIADVNPHQLFTKKDYLFSSAQIKKIQEIVKLRNEKHIPLAYLLEEAYFLDLELFVNNAVLIPRPETELLVTETLKKIKEDKLRQISILDLCTGSGCIALALKRALPSANVYASDISKDALNVALINAGKYKQDINFILGDYLDPFLSHQRSPVALPIIRSSPPYFDVVISNPPYIAESDYVSLAAELMHEPKHALVGFPYAHIREQLKGLIKPNGFFAFEFGYEQTPKILEIFPKAVIHKDLAGIDRFAFVSEEDL